MYEAVYHSTGQIKLRAQGRKLSFRKVEIVPFGEGQKDQNVHSPTNILILLSCPFFLVLPVSSVLSSSKEEHDQIRHL